MEKITRQPQTSLYPAPAILVSSQIGDKTNIITLAWAGILASKPVTIGLGIRPERYSYDIIKESGELVINLAMASQVQEVDHCGLVSGRDRDKFLDCNFTPISGSKVKAPLIKECPVNLECIVQKIIPLGSHDLFLAEVVLVHYSQEFFTNGRFDLKKAEPLAYGLREYYSLGEVLGPHGLSIARKR